MNGRVYDYNIGRFLSVDPFIQSPGDSQSVNPYSYIMNNPLSGTDPTGYCAAATGTRIKSCGDMKVEVKVTMKDGSTKTETAVVKDVNFRNGAEVGAALSTGVNHLAGKFSTLDIGSQGKTAKYSGNSANKQFSTAANSALDSVEAINTDKLDAEYSAIGVDTNNFGETAFLDTRWERMRERELLDSVGGEGTYLQITGDAAMDAALVVVPIPGLAFGANLYKFGKHMPRLKKLRGSNGETEGWTISAGGGYGSKPRFDFHRLPAGGKGAKGMPQFTKGRKLPHYHRRGPGGIGLHRPFQVKPSWKWYEKIYKRF
ncbi:RHS repeat-associated core domain-containing protein [Thalassotalea sp. PS06]|uniref:RHS repeat-associated core domain-containing protein n=1 Tax=Thalassotalea sp. PS06 TaxID=2594005 RepID=UPI0021B10693|nr:RHS repeat-associated core domain-containing protein [Thalassotalea sp. PS06]